MTVLAPSSLSLFPPPSHRFQHFGVPFGAIIAILASGFLGSALPLRRSLWIKVLFTLLGIGLCWLLVMLSGPRVTIPFATLLLVLVMRACLLFNWTGRIAVALAAFFSFVLRLGGMLLWFQRRFALGGRMPRSLRRLPAEELNGLLLSFGVGSAVLFGLVLVFVLVMVGSLVTENQSRQKLAMANRRLQRYSLLVENQATIQERSRIAREIHDSLGHALTAQSIQLENVALWFDQDGEKAKIHLATARGLSKEALSNIRQAVAKLRQEPLQGQTLPDALQKVLDEFEATTKVQVHARLTISETLPKEIAIALYRLVQESLTNIAKHAKATEVELKLSENDSAILLQIQDNGQGFTVRRNLRGFGLTSMRERTEALRGRFQIISEPHQGCQILISIPQ